MARINIVNADNKIDATPQRAYFKLKQTGGPKGEKGDTGAQGPIGPQGPQGASASVSVNSTTTLPAGSSATVENIGTAQNVKLNFGIPTGPQGPQGEQGPQGAQGPQGPQGEKGAKGNDGAAATVDVNATNTGAPGTNALVENVGTNTAALLNFTIPRGEKGETGTNATIEVGTTTTLPAGDNATVQNVGSQTAAVLNFGIPQGEKGEKGDDGASFSTQVVPALPETGEENVFYLTPKAHTTETATGNPITATVTEGAGAIESFQLDGGTFQQSYEGKNLFNAFAEQYSNNLADKGISLTIQQDGSFVTSGTNTGTYAFVRYDITLPAGTYWVGGCPSGGSSNGYSICVEPMEGQGQLFDTGSGVSFTNTAERTIRLYPVRIGSATVSLDGKVFKPILAVGSTATSFEPYVGGVPSPNPDYPQLIQTVTDEQAVTIGNTAYPINLGSIELCKLGTYEDYIWKDGDDWKVHKATGKILSTQNTGWYKHATTNGNVFVLANSGFVGFSYDSGKAAPALMDTDRVAALTTGHDADYGVFGVTSSQQVRVFRGAYSSSYTASQFIGEMNGHYIVGALVTATDTTITDATLIAQLEAIRTASLEDGANTITNTATAPNLAGDMEIGYYSYNPRNRYDKWLWLDINNEYEQIGS